jgi:CheY-like chemotaxis protein
MLEDLGHRVTLAGSGAAAMALLVAGQGFDLMITDFAMPGMDGLELARRATQLRPLLPVVLATGYAELAVTAETTLPRLDKPYRQEALAAMIGRVVEPPLGGGNVVRLPRMPRG